MYYIRKGAFSPAPQLYSAFICFLKTMQFTGRHAIYQAAGLVFCRQVCFFNQATTSKTFFSSCSRFLRDFSRFNNGWASRVVATTYQAIGFVFSGKVCNASEIMQTPYNKQNHQHACSAGLATATRFARRCFGRYTAAALRKATL